MPDSPSMIVIVFLLLPGLIGYGLFQALTPTRQPSWTTRFVIAIILSLVSYIELRVLGWCVPILPNAEQLASAAAKPDPQALLSIATLMAVFLACILSVLNAVGMVLVHNHQLLHRVAGRCGLTAKTGFSSNWDGVFWCYRESCWVHLQFVDGTALAGWVVQHSDASEERSLLLNRIRQYDAKGDSFEWPMEEMAFIGDLSKVHFLRFIPEKEVGNEQAEQSQPSQ